MYRRRSLLQRIRTRKLQSPRRDHAVHVSLSSYAVVKEPEAGPTSYARPTSAVRAVWHIPSVSPNEATFNTLPNPLSTLSFEPIDRFAERRISSSAAAPPSLERFIRTQPKTVNTQRRKIFKSFRNAASESAEMRGRLRGFAVEKFLSFHLAPCTSPPEAASSARSAITEGRSTPPTSPSTRPPPRTYVRASALSICCSSLPLPVRSPAPG